jgi:hypothetical protein
MDIINKFRRTKGEIIGTNLAHLMRSKYPMAREWMKSKINQEIRIPKL